MYVYIYWLCKDIPKGVALRCFPNVPCSIVVVDPNGVEFVMKIEKRGEGYFITEGWSSFFSTLKVMLYYRLYFVYIGKRRFSASILLDSFVTYQTKNYHVNGVLNTAGNFPGT